MKLKPNEIIKEKDVRLEVKMINRPITENQLEGKFGQMIGQICWGVHFQHINLSFNFGNPKLVHEGCNHDPKMDCLLRRYTRVKGQWFMWVYNSYWKLTVINPSNHQIMIATSTSTNHKKRLSCSFLCGQKLVYLHINSKTGRTKLVFDLNAELIIRRPKKNDKELWKLDVLDDCRIIIHGDGSYDFEDIFCEKGKITNVFNRDITTGMNVCF